MTLPRLTHPNRVLTPTVLQWVETEIPIVLARTRQERTQLEDRWLRWWKMWAVQLDQQSYLGRSQVYLAAVRSAIETWLVATQDGLCPMTEWFTVQPAPFVDEQRARRWQALQQRWLTKEMRFEEQLPEFLRQFFTYGTAVARHVWDEQIERHRVWERQLEQAPLDMEMHERRIRDAEPDDADDDLAFLHQGTRVRLVEKDVAVRCGPFFRPVDLFHFYVCPMTAASIHDAVAAFEDLEVPIEELEAKHTQFMDPELPKFGRVYDHPEWEQVLAQKGFLPTDLLQAQSERWEHYGLSPDPETAYAKMARKGNVQLTECYWRGEIPDARDETGELYGVRDWLFVFVNDTYCVRIQPNPSYTQQRPWVDARMYRTTGLYYGQGVVDAIGSIQYYVNDMANLSMDNIVLALNPIVTVDDSLGVTVETLQWAPGAKWFGPKEAFNPLVIPTQAQLGLTTINMMQGFIHDFSRASATSQGAPAARGRGRSQQTYGGMALQQAGTSAAFGHVIKDIEQQLAVPVLERNYGMASQFLTDKQVLQVLGADGAILLTEEVGFEDVFGEYRYAWRGATAVREKQALVGALQQLPQLMQFMPRAAQLFDEVEFCKRLLADGYGISWYDKIFKADPAPAIDPRLELTLFAEHRPALPQQGDDDQQHLMVHMLALQQDPRFQRDPIARQLLMEHIQATIAAAQAKLQAQQQAQQQAMMQMMAGGGEGQQGPGMNAQGSLAAPEGPPAPDDMMRQQAMGGVG